LIFSDTEIKEVSQKIEQPLEKVDEYRLDNTTVSEVAANHLEAVQVTGFVSEAQRFGA
jgi:hypothetical protein